MISTDIKDPVGFFCGDVDSGAIQDVCDPSWQVSFDAIPFTNGGASMQRLPSTLTTPERQYDCLKGDCAIVVGSLSGPELGRVSFELEGELSPAFRELPQPWPGYQFDAKGEVALEVSMEAIDLGESDSRFYRMTLSEPSMEGRYAVMTCDTLADRQLSCVPNRATTFMDASGPSSLMAVVDRDIACETSCTVIVVDTAEPERRSRAMEIGV